MKHLLFLAILAFSLTSCRTVSTHEATTRTEIRTDTLRILQLQRDSVFLHDSIFQTLERKGDTVFLTKTVTRYKTRDRWRTDTIFETKATKETKDTKATKEAKTPKTLSLYAQVLIVIAAAWLFMAIVGVLRKKS